MHPNVIFVELKASSSAFDMIVEFSPHIAHGLIHQCWRLPSNNNDRTHI